MEPVKYKYRSAYTSGTHCRFLWHLRQAVQSLVRRSKGEKARGNRPGEMPVNCAMGDERMLIEICLPNGEDEQAGFELVLEALNTMKAMPVEVNDAWMNDEVWITFQYHDGQFLLSRDIWGFVFITSDEHQDIISQLNDTLMNHEMFISEPIDMNAYRKSVTQSVKAR